MKLSCMGLAMTACAACLAGCLEHSPYDASVCRSGTFSRPNSSEGNDTTFVPFADQGDDVSQCRGVDAVVIEGTGDTRALDDLINVNEIRRLSIGPTANLTGVNGLANLTTVTGDLTVIDNLRLSNIAGFGSLVEVGGGITFEDNPELSLCDVEVALDRLAFVPDTVTVSGVLPCPQAPTTETDLGTGYADALLIFEGLFELFDVSATSGTSMLLAGLSTTNVSILDEARVELANTATVSNDVNGVAVATDPSGGLDWSLFFGGDWPLSFRDDVVLRFAQIEDAPLTAVYAGLVTNIAHIGEVTIERGERETLWAGFVDADGVASTPVRIDGPSLDNITSVVAIKAERRDRVWVLVKGGDGIFSTHTLILTNLTETTEPALGPSMVVSRGPVEITSMTISGDGVVMTGRRSGAGAVVIGNDDSVPLDGNFGFVVRVDGRSEPLSLLYNVLEALVSFPDGAGGTDAPDCFAIRRGRNVYGVGTDLAGSMPIGRIQAFDISDLTAPTPTSDMYGVGGRPPLGLPFDPLLACGLSIDGRVVASGLDTFARGDPARTVGWRLSTIETGALRARVQALTIGRIRGPVDQIRATVAPDGTALLHGPLPLSLQLTPTLVESRGQPEVFVATRRVFDAAP